MRRRVSAWLSVAAVAFLPAFAGGGIAAPPPQEPRRVPWAFSDIEVVRKTPQGYLVTASALIPFRAEVRSDHALQRVTYIVTAARFGAGGKTGPEGKEHRLAVGAFTQRSQQRNLLQFDIAADDATTALDLSKLSQLFRETDANQPPSRYRLRVLLEATDNDPATGPRTGRSEPVTFVVVSELELLSEIAKEEEVLRLALEDRVAGRLRRAQSDIQRLNERLATATPEQFPDLYRRADEVSEAVRRATESVQNIHTDFRRIVRELRVNRVRAAMIDRVEKTVRAPLDDALRRESVPAAAAIRELCKSLEGDDPEQARKAGAAARHKLDALVGRIAASVGAARDLADLNGQMRLLLQTQHDMDRLLGDRQ